MDNRTPEREWLLKVAGNVAKEHTHKEVQEKGTKEKNSPQPSPSKKRKGLEDVAGMTQLKELIVEGFINVLRNRTCAETYGIKPPSLLLYGPAGCGKTFFAEKVAEELGIHFMKIVPDDLACTWIHGTQQKIGELFREAEKKAPTLMFFDEFDAMVPKRSENDATNHIMARSTSFYVCLIMHVSVVCMCWPQPIIRNALTRLFFVQDVLTRLSM